MSNRSRERYHARTEYFGYLEETTKAVDVYVRQFLQTKNIENTDLREQLASRYRFGKPQLRPSQIRMAYELVGGIDWEKTIPCGASLELKDTGYYCFDDILDSKANLKLMVLGGMFLSISYKMTTDLFKDFSSKQVKKIIEELFELDSQNASAALIDLNLKEPNLELYLQKVKGYNFWEQALRIGAILGNATNEELEIVGEAGKNIGMGYIIANDTWDFGKELEDFRAGKYTLPIMFMFENVINQKRNSLEKLFGKENLSLEQITEIREIAVHSKAIERGKEVSKKYCDEGIRLLQYFPKSKARNMIEFATTMTQKNKFYKILEQYE